MSSSPDVELVLAAWDLGHGDSAAVTVGQWHGGNYEINDVLPLTTRMSDAEYRASARRWWARPWQALSKRDRRRLKRNPALLAQHSAWNMERESRIEAWLLRAMGFELQRMVTHGATGAGPRIGAALTTENVLAKALGPVPFDGTGDTIGADGPLDFREEP